MPDSPTPSGFDAFALDPRIHAAVGALGFDTPTPIQLEAIPHLLEGRDVIGGARTGSGKTAAFGLPLLHRLREGGPNVRALLLTPTRELALQVTVALRSYAKGLPVRVVTIYGGAPYGPQLKALAEGVSVVVGTPGRVLDHLERGSLDLSKVEVLVLDEADEMLRMGFLEDVERVLDAMPEERQVALFSATMPPPIRQIAVRRMKEPVQVQVETAELTVKHIDQRWLEVPPRFKVDALARVLASEPPGATLVFARTRAGCAEVTEAIAKRGFDVDALHGDLNQQAREAVLGRLRRGRLSAVVATDVAARGIDVDLLTLVVNYDLPDDAEQYVHRIGRTARAGRAGSAIAFVAPRELFKLKRIERALDVSIVQMEVPSDAEIAARAITKIRATLDALDDETVLGAESLVETLLEGRSPRELARAVVALIARERGLDPSATPDPKPPGWARAKAPTARPERARNEDRDWVALFLPVGKVKGVRPADIVGAISNELGVSSSEIGRITILDHQTFVEVSRELCERIRKDRRVLEIRGVEAPISLARPGTQPERRGRPASPYPDRAAPKRHGKAPRPTKRWNRKKT